MCGIAGFWEAPGASAAELAARSAAMARPLVHRGPDDEGTWVEVAQGVGLAFRRLAILDLSPLGHQPMQSVERRYTVVFNGEIYNFRDLRAELASNGHSFRGASDTEVLLAACSAWGTEAMLKRISGMFAIAIWDATERRLTLARDRIGKKPVYYGRFGRTWLFGSELKALRAHPAFVAEIDRDTLSQYLRYSYVPSPRSIYVGVSKLPPAHFVTLKQDADPVLGCYWDAADAARRGQADPLRVSDSELVDDLEALLKDAVARRMIADVPLGAFLSGGLDSSTVVALMQACSRDPVRTFTIGFNTPGFNEAEAAKAVAAHLGTDHTELYVTPEEARSVIPCLPTIYDEPFADASQIPTYLVSRLARRHVTVALSGDGGDELFTGYNRYFWAPSIWSRVGSIPVAARRAVAQSILTAPPAALDRVYAGLQPVLPRSWHVNRPADKLQKVAGVARATDQMDLYLRLVSAWHQPDEVVVDGREPALPASSSPYLPDGFEERMMYRDLLTYLPDDVLAKVDRASMAVSLEVRAPLLDHRVVEWAWRVPRAQRVRDGEGKWVLRQLLYRHVPAALVDRPKMGFGVPIDEWLRGPLREWAEGLLSERVLEAGGLLRAAPIRRIWHQHLTGRRNEQTRLWPILMFQAWRVAWCA